MIKSVLDYLEKSADIYAEKTAFSDENGSMTFAELKMASLQIATSLLKYVSSRDAVVIYLPKCVECVAAFLGSRYAGAYYVPVDVEAPSKRIADILRLCKAKCIIASRSMPPAEDILRNLPSRPELVYIEDALKEGVTVDRAEIDRRRLSQLDIDPVYAIFTSGSTGIPKGVLICERSLLNLSEWFCEAFSIGPEEIIANQAPFFFDASVKEIYGTLRSGATLHIVPKRLFSQPVKLIAFLNDVKASLIAWVPSVLCMIANFNVLKKTRPQYLKKLIFMGELMPTKQLNVWRRELPSDVLFANLYGPTETTVDCAYYILDRDFADDDPIPIGKACNNTEIMLLDEDGNVVAEEGKSGEICVRGISLAIGYLNSRAATESAFQYHDFGNGYMERVYHTGDIGKYNEFGEILFLCRRDNQIKHIGHRIELGDIESQLSALEGIGRCCCIYDGDSDRIAAFYEGGMEADAARAGLSEALPHYMVPNIFYKMDSLPLNKNGKIDRTFLKSLLQEGK